MAGTVLITQEEYDALLESQKMLSALEAAGVDNWEGYSIAAREAMGEE